MNGESLPNGAEITTQGLPAMLVSHKLDDLMISLCKDDKRVLVASAKEHLRNAPRVIHETENQLDIFRILGYDGRFIVRTTKGASSEKGVGRENIKDEGFKDKFDRYLIPRINDKEFEFFIEEK